MLIENPIVLLVDDSENDALLVRIAFERAGFVAPLHVVHDGEQAIAYLSGDGVFGDRAKFPLPTALLLDLNMHRQNGFDVLVWVRKQPELKRLCVYILSASSQPVDIHLAYDLGANSYLVKPGTFDEMKGMARGLLAWLKLSHFCGVETNLPTDPEPRDDWSAKYPQLLRGEGG